jgi:hypothetical protein
MGANFVGIVVTDLGKEATNMTLDLDLEDVKVGIRSICVDR